MKSIRKAAASAVAAIASSAGALTAHGADATSPIDGTEDIVSWIDRLKESATEVAIAIIALAFVGVAIVCATSKNGLEKAKPWIIGILIAAGVLLFADGLISSMM